MCLKYQCEFIFSKGMGSINIVRHKHLMSCNDTLWINVALSAEQLFCKYMYSLRWNILHH